MFAPQGRRISVAIARDKFFAERNAMVRLFIELSGASGDQESSL